MSDNRIKVVGLKIDEANKLLNYLSSRPFSEVHQLVPLILSGQQYDVPGVENAPPALVEEQPAAEEANEEAPAQEAQAE